MKTYDFSNANDALKKQLAKRGLIQEKEYEQFFPQTKDCICGAVIGFAEKMCPKCKRLLDRDYAKRNIEADEIVTMILEKIAGKNKELIFETIKELGLVDKIKKV